MPTCPDNEKHEWKLGVPCGPCVSVFKWVRDIARRKKGSKQERTRNTKKKKRSFFKPHSCFYSIRLHRGKRKRVMKRLYSLDWHMCCQNADRLTLVCRFRVAGLRQRLSKVPSSLSDIGWTEQQRSQSAQAHNSSSFSLLWHSLWYLDLLTGRLCLHWCAAFRHSINVSSWM